MKVVVLAAVCTVGCKFPELPALGGDAAGSSDGGSDASGDGSPGAPSVAITSGPAANSKTGPRVTFEFTASGGSAYCKFDSNALAPCTSPLAVNLPAGTHTFHVQVEGSGGNVVSDERLWTVECLPRQATTDTFGLYRFEEGTGTTVVNQHPYGPFPPHPQGTLTFAAAPADPSWTSAGRFGSALRFSAQALNDTDRIYGNLLDPSIADELGAHSVEMWVNPNPTFTHDLNLIGTSGGNQTGHMDYTLKFRKNGAQGNFILATRTENNSIGIMSQAVAVGSYHYVAISFAPGTQAILFVDGQTFKTPQPLVGTVDMFDFDGFFIYEGEVDELHLTLHRYTDQELLEQYCPL